MCSDSVSLSSISTAWWGTRHFVTLMLFMGMANAYVMRTNMSVAIVAMAKHTGTDDEDSPSSNECPDRIDQIVSTLALGGGGCGWYLCVSPIGTHVRASARNYGANCALRVRYKQNPCSGQTVEMPR